MKPSLTTVHLCILAVLALLPMFFNGDGLIAPIGLDLQTNATDFWYKMFFQWDSQVSLGNPNNFPGWFFPVGTFFAFLSYIGIPGYLAVKFWYISTLFIVGITMYFFLWAIFDNYWREIGDGEIYCLVGAIGYMCNPYVVMQCDNGHFLVPYAILPLQLMVLHKGLKNGKIRYAVLMGVSAIIVSTNLPTVAINYIVIFLYAIYYLFVIDFGKRKQTIKFVFVALSFMSLCSLWYYLPLAAQFFGKSTTLLESIQQEDWHMYNRTSSFLETLRLLGVWGLYSGWGGKYSYEFAPYYLFNTIGVFVTLLIPILAALSIMLSKFKMNALNRKKLLFFATLILVAAFLAVGAYPPIKPGLTGMIYIFLYENIPFFPMFRNGYKFVGLMALGYSLLIAVGMSIIVKSLELKGPAKGVIFIKSLIVIVFLLSALPLLSGKVFSPKNSIKIPAYWEKITQWRNNQDNNSRIFLLPDQYFATYYWGSGIFRTSIPYITKDVIVNSPTISGDGGIILMRMLYASTSGNEDSGVVKYQYDVPEDYFCNIARLLDIKYIIQRNDINYKIYNVLSPPEIKHFLQSQKCVTYVETFDKLDLYQLKEYPLPRIYSK